MNELEDPKDVLLRYIDNMPGIGYRELLRFTGLSNGALAYHLSRLEKASQIRIDRQKEKRTTTLFDRYSHTRIRYSPTTEK